MEGELRVKYKGKKCNASVRLGETEAKILKEVIERSGLTQEQFAEIYETSAPVFSNWINGHRSIDLGILYELYDVTGRPSELHFVEEYLSQCKTGNFELELKRNPRLREQPQIVYTTTVGRLRTVYNNSDSERQRHIIKSIEELLE